MNQPLTLETCKNNLPPEIVAKWEEQAIKDADVGYFSAPIADSPAGIMERMVYIEAWEKRKSGN